MTIEFHRGSPRAVPRSVEASALPTASADVDAAKWAELARKVLKVFSKAPTEMQELALEVFKEIFQNPREAYVHYSLLPNISADDTIFDSLLLPHAIGCLMRRPGPTGITGALRVALESNAVPIGKLGRLLRKTARSGAHSMWSQRLEELAHRQLELPIYQERLNLLGMTATKAEISQALLALHFQPGKDLVRSAANQRSLLLAAIFEDAALDVKNQLCASIAADLDCQKQKDAALQAVLHDYPELDFNLDHNYIVGLRDEKLCENGASWQQTLLNDKTQAQDLANACSYLRGECKALTPVARDILGPFGKRAIFNHPGESRLLVCEQLVNSDEAIKYFFLTPEGSFDLTHHPTLLVAADWLIRPIGSGWQGRELKHLQQLHGKLMEKAGALARPELLARLGDEVKLVCENAGLAQVPEQQLNHDLLLNLLTGSQAKFAGLEGLDRQMILDQLAWAALDFALQRPLVHVGLVGFRHLSAEEIALRKIRRRFSTNTSERQAHPERLPDFGFLYRSPWVNVRSLFDQFCSFRANELAERKNLYAQIEEIASGFNFKSGYPRIYSQYLASEFLRRRRAAGTESGELRSVIMPALRSYAEFESLVSSLPKSEIKPVTTTGMRNAFIRQARYWRDPMPSAEETLEFMMSVRKIALRAAKPLPGLNSELKRDLFGNLARGYPFEELRVLKLHASRVVQRYQALTDNLDDLDPGLVNLALAAASFEANQPDRSVETQKLAIAWRIRIAKQLVVPADAQQISAPTIHTALRLLLKTRRGFLTTDTAGELERLQKNFEIFIDYKLVKRSKSQTS